MCENKFHVPRCGTDTKVSTFHLAVRFLVGDAGEGAKAQKVNFTDLISGA